jgi:ABC-2 type transport system ATP-binding protein
LSGAENLELFSRLYGLGEADRRPAMERWLRRLDLWVARDRAFGTYSKGMKQRLALIRAVIHEPRVIFLDEPTSGLDPAAARDVRGLIAELKRDGRTILMCTHHLGEAQQLADLVGIMQRRLIAFGTLDELAGSSGRIEIRLAGAAAGFVDGLRRARGVVSVAASGDTLRIEVAEPDIYTPSVVSGLVLRGAPIREVRPVRASLEEIYLKAIEEAT